MGKDNDYVENLLRENEELKLLLISSNNNINLAGEALLLSNKTIKSCFKAISMLKALVLVLILCCFVGCCFLGYMVIQFNSFIN